MKYNKYTFSQLAKIKYGKNQKKVVSEKGTIPIYGTGGLMGYATQFLYDKPSVLIGRKGTIEKVRYIERPFWTVDTLFYTEINENLVLPKYLYYVLSNMDLKQYNEGTTIPSLRTETLNRLEFNIPLIEEQKKILNILKTLEDKIILNEKINNNLEQQVQTIFDDMFPDIFSLNANATLQDLIVFTNGKKRPETIGNIPVYGGNGVLAYTDESNANNCVIIGRVGAYCGNTFLCLDKCWTSDNAIQAKSRNESSPLFIYYLLRNASLFSRHIGTGQPLMTQGILNAIPIKYPLEEKVSTFIDICTPAHKMIFSNIQQNKFLVSTRESLLPKLISGELDVSDLDI
ncbi:restriction endonuclease subunit S [Lachnospira intestinalis]|uniref:Restriction endonuclease subunit S n=1 Tax=Lachnospira intestinalis TaxID=3133158 RepID=A0ABV1H220_9FIRM